MTRHFILMTMLLSATAAWPSAYHWKFGVDSKSESVGDKDSSFVVEDWNCTVGAPTVDASRNEIRRLGCNVGKEGLQVYVLPVCYVIKGKPKTDGGVLNLQMKSSGSKMVSLTCDNPF